MSLHEFLQKLDLRDGVWFFPSSAASVNYPDEGHEFSFEIEDHSYWYRHRNNCIAYSVARFKPPTWILDAGGGNGIVSLRLQRDGYEVALLEPSSKSVAKAKSRGVHFPIQGQIGDLPRSPNSLGSVGLFDVIEHVEDDRALLKEIHARMGASEKLYLSVPAFQWLFSNDDRYARHCRRYSANQIRRVLNDAGFETLWHSYIFSLLLLPVLLLRTLPSLIKRRDSIQFKKGQYAISASWISRLVDWVFGIELELLKGGVRIPFGTSLIVVAQKAAVNEA